jgi:hypothetical protein
MYSLFCRGAAKLTSLLLGAILLAHLGPAMLRTIEQTDLLLAQLSLGLCEIGLAVLRLCGI